VLEGAAGPHCCRAALSTAGGRVVWETTAPVVPHVSSGEQVLTLELSTPPPGRYVLAVAGLADGDPELYVIELVAESPPPRP